MFSIGAITGPHGLNGYIKVFPLTDDTGLFSEIESVYIDENGELKKRFISDVKHVKKFILLKLEGIDTMDDALKIKGFKLKVTEDAVKPLEPDEYFARDLYGIDVTSDNGEELGKITDILFTGANDVYIINGSLLIPAIKQCILDINIKEKKMTVHLPEGLR
jgi:16S rRNA processing protein RimM